MTHIKSKFLTTLIVIVFLSACTTPTKTGGEESVDEKKYNVYKAPASQAYPEASLKLVAPDTTSLDTGAVAFEFEVSNYELGIQTPDAEGRGIANSEKGQHIHLIIDNGPYSAHYEPTFAKKMESGNHVILAFLSRSYHEAVKNDSSYILTTVAVGNPNEPSTFDPSGQHLFFSRPKGTYSGTDTEKLMIDFWLINTSISPDGNKVKATINGEEHLITEWAPYFVEGLEKGELSLKLELIDKDGNLIPGPYNSVERKVTLE